MKRNDPDVDDCFVALVWRKSTLISSAKFEPCHLWKSFGQLARRFPIAKSFRIRRVSRKLCAARVMHARKLDGLRSTTSVSNLSHNQ